MVKSKFGKSTKLFTSLALSAALVIPTFAVPQTTSAKPLLPLVLIGGALLLAGASCEGSGGASVGIDRRKGVHADAWYDGKIEV